MANNEKALKMKPDVCNLCNKTHPTDIYWCDRCDTAHSPYECPCEPLHAAIPPSEDLPMSEPRKPCQICGAPTDLACADCAINDVEAPLAYVCTRSQCRDAHEKAARCNPQPVPGAAPRVRERPEPEAREVGAVKPWHFTALWAALLLVLGAFNALAGVGSPGFTYGFAAAALIWGIEAACEARRERDEDA